MQLVKNTPFLFFAKTWFQNQEKRSAFSKFKASIFSIFLGTMISIVIMYALNANGFSVFGEMFEFSFGKFSLQKTLWLASIYTVVALANAVAFKSGLFNIGVSGQMFFAGTVVILFGTKLLAGLGVGGILILIIVAMLSGALVSMFVGWLKTRFNVHEVISSILLNFALFFLGRFILSSVPGVLGQSDSGTVELDRSYAKIKLEENWGLILFFAVGVLSALILAFVFWKTRFGFNAKTTGMNPDAAEHAGINKRRQIIMSLVLSGVVAGVAAILVFVLTDDAQEIGRDFFIDSDVSQGLPYGFDGIALSLIAFNNPIGILPVAVFFAGLKNGAVVLTNFSLSGEVYNLIIGLVMYFAAISVLFIRFRILQMFYVYWKLHRVKDVLQLKQDYKREIAEYKKISFKKEDNQMVHALKKAARHTKGRTSEFFYILFRKTKGDLHNESTHTTRRTLRKHYRQKLHAQKLKVVIAYERKVSRYASLSRTVEFEKLKQKFKKPVPPRASMPWINRLMIRLRPMSRADRTRFAAEVDDLLEGGELW